jgi:type IV pilus assembly protein PilQ
MYNKIVTYHFAIFSALCVLLFFHSNGYCVESSTPKSIAYTIQDVRADISSDSIAIKVVGNTAPAYTSYEQFDPFRLVIDIAEAVFDNKLNADKLIPDNEFVKLSATILKGQSPAITRLVFQIKDKYQYKVEREDNNLLVRIFPGAAEKGASAGDKQTGQAVSKNNKNPGSDATLDELIGSSVAALEKKNKKASVSEQAMERISGLEDPFTNAGYKKQRISVDFYKIDIHNVFRLFRQISDVNIVIDEAVKGSVTISLNNVPWDFALDIICNLADLKKEERLNTIVIYPKKKDLEWPASPTDNLSIKADKDVIQQEALIVQQVANQPKEVSQAKELIIKAQAKEKSEEFQDAVTLYEQAFTLWPTNERLSNKLAALYLVNLQMNAKAIFYAQKSLKIKPHNDNAALYAAIASANMNRLPEAMEYFNQSISGSPPLKEALVSYAAFNENFGKPEAALKLLDKYNVHYGETLETMLAKARIYDKMGNSSQAITQYRSILSSGYQIRPDLVQYIQGRLQAGNF